MRAKTSCLVATFLLCAILPANAQRVDAYNTELTPRQVENLVLLGKVWGFTKYHHPRVTSGGADWDAELRRVLPNVLAATDRVAAAGVISTWLQPFNDFANCAPCATLRAEVHLRPEIDWIRDEGALGRQLSQLLVRAYANRSAGTRQHYVSFAPNIGNPVFENEPEYATPPLPPPDLRLVALYRFWNVIEYWFPYRDLIEEDWDGVLREFVPRLWAADNVADYQRTAIALVARAHDTHANVWNALAARPPVGTHRLPVTIRFIEDKAVVTGFANDTLGRASGLQAGDVITAMNGQRVDSLVTAWAPFYAASNQPTRLRDIARAMTQGPPGVVRIVGERAGRRFEIETPRVDAARIDRTAGLTHDLPGPTFQMLTDEVAYVKLSTVTATQTASYIGNAAAAKVLVIDIRNYPREFVVFALGRHLVASVTPFARFTQGDAANPGAFTYGQPVALQPAEPRFNGSVVILIDEVSQSQSEYTTMAFRSAPNALVVGSTTAGADGNVSPVLLPGGLRAMISGIGVFYPDRKPTQRIGIIPDLVVRPTIAGIREGRDEVLEAGVSRALGREFHLPRR